MLSLCNLAKYTVLSDESVLNIIITINVASLIIAAPGNIITLAVIAKVRRLRKQPTYLFIGSVCMADALVATITQPLYIISLLLESSDKYCKLYTIFFVVGWLSAFGSVVGLNMVTLDRFFFISYPLRYPMYMTRKRAMLLVLLTWTIALSFALLPVAWLSSIVLYSLLFAHNSVSCILVGVTYHRIYQKVRHSAKKHSSSLSFGGDGARDEAAAQRQATKTVFIVVFFFVICWGPWTVLSFAMSIKEQYIEDIGAAYHKKTFKIIHSFSLTLGFLSSACNVFIYTFKNKSLRKEWLKFICGSMRKRTFSSRSELDVEETIINKQ